MPQHALDRPTIAEFILKLLPKESEAQLFLLNCERMVLRDFSRYDRPRSRRRVGEAISTEYLDIMHQMVKAESPQDADALLTLLDELRQVCTAKGTRVVRLSLEEAARLVRFFPQNCFAYVGGAFFEAYLRGSTSIKCFKQVDRQLYCGEVGAVGREYSPNSPRFKRFVYSQECGELANCVSASLRSRVGNKWLYVAPIICDDSFFGVLYRFASGQSKKVVKELRSAVEKAAVQFGEMRYTLIADVAIRLGSLEDAFGIFLDELPKYHNVALALSWPPTGEPTVYAHDFPDVSDLEDDARPFFRQLPWARRKCTNVLRDPSSRRAHIVKLSATVCALAKPRWIRAIDGSDLLIPHPTEVLSDEVLQRYRRFGLPIRYGVIIPGGLTGEAHRHKALEVYYFDPPELDFDPETATRDQLLAAARKKLQILILLLQEVMIFQEKVEREAHEVRSWVQRFLAHEIRGTLEHFKSEMDVHVVRLLDALAFPARSQITTQTDWVNVTRDLELLRGRFGYNWRIQEWPGGLTYLGVSPHLLYFICAELGRNGSVHGGGDVRLEIEQRARCAVLTVESNGEAGSVTKIRAALDSHEIGSPDSSGLPLIKMLLRLVWRDTDEHLRAEALDGGRLSVLCDFPLALTEDRP